MLKRESKSAILNVSSGAASVCFPGGMLYSMSKCFLSYFTQGLEFELRSLKKKIDVLDFKAGPVETKLSKS